MVTKTGVTGGGDVKSYQGLSSDTKPTTCGSGSTFYELDTKKAWVYDANNVNPGTATKWWEA